MSSLKDIKKRISSVKSTQKITRAMKLVSAAKLKRATNRAELSRPYESELRDIIASVLRETEWGSPLLLERPLKKVLFVVLSSDRGLCGSLNTNLFKLAQERKKELAGVEVETYAIGKKACSVLGRRDFNIAKSTIDLIRNSSYEALEAISKELKVEFLEERYDRVEVFYNKFQSAMVQIPTAVQLLPYALPEFGEDEESVPPQYLYEPEGLQLLDKLVPSFIDFQFYRFALEQIASEHGARMLAMENATKNAGDMISKLTLQRNRARQAVITKELMEIIGGAEALAG